MSDDPTLPAPQGKAPLFGDDVLGAKATAKGLRYAIETGVDVLYSVVGPAAEELGLLLKDHVRGWRLTNILRLNAKFKKIMQDQGVDPAAVHSPPRLAFRIIEQASWEDHDDIQDLWAGILASSCTNDGRDDGNLIYVDLLSQINGSQARLIRHTVYKTKKLNMAGLVVAGARPYMSLSGLQTVMALEDRVRIDRELDHLSSLALLGEPVIAGEAGVVTGFLLSPHMSMKALVTPTALAINFVVRATGSRASPAEFFDLELEAAPADRPGGTIREDQMIDPT